MKKSKIVATIDKILDTLLAIDKWQKDTDNRLNHLETYVPARIIYSKAKKKPAKKKGGKKST